jgi:predicted dehydrogenase
VNRAIRLGMVGGGPGSAIGPTHLWAALLDGHFQIVAGAFSTDHGRCIETANAIGLDTARAYPDYQVMAAKEAVRADGIEAVAILTPNNSHTEICLAFLAAGVHVICDKPLATTLADTLRVRQAVADSGLVFVLTHNYSGYAMVREARAMVGAGALGAIRLVQVEHAHGGASTAVEREGNKQIAWRTDSKIAGPSFVIGDLGTHAHHLTRFITGLEVEQLTAEISTFVAGRTLDDNAHLGLRLSNGARGQLWASAVAAGHRNGLRIRVFGETASLEWLHEDPDRLHLRPIDGPHRTFMRGEPWLGEDAKHANRLKPGQTEGVIEGFANIYNDAVELIRAHQAGRAPAPSSRLVPGVEDGVCGVAFIEAAVASNAQDGAWTQVETP